MSKSPLTISISVRDLVEFVLRTGDLAGGGGFVGPTRALEGTRGHQRIQRSRPKEYETEVSVSHQIETAELVLTIKGRIDGILRTPELVLIDEIKTVMGASGAEADPMHWAQGKMYAAIYLQKYPRESIDVQITYLDLDAGGVTEHRQSFSSSDLSGFFAEVTSCYMEWLKQHVQWLQTRDPSIKSLSFPFPEYRKGQRELAVAVYRTLARGGRLFAEAPTGIGKTISVLFPALKAMSEGKLSKIFYLTAKTIGRIVAEKTLADMRQAGLRLRAVTLTAKEKICFNSGQPCDIRTCPFAIGYYDRVKIAIKAALEREALTKAAIEEVARQHQVCPFELSLDVSLWVDAIICDYNYVFDPRVYLKRYFSEETGDYAFLIDEAHNLVDRAREMFSAELRRTELLELNRILREDLPHCAKTLRKAAKHFAAWKKEILDRAKPWAGGRDCIVSTEVPSDFISSLRAFLKEAESWLVQNKAAPFREPLLELYFRVTAFTRTADLFDERYLTIFDLAPVEPRIRLYCLAPSFLIGKALERGISAIFFSATLAPMEYFREILGGGVQNTTLQLASPFPAENFKVLVEDSIGTNFKERELTYDEVARSIVSVVQPRRGNYLVYFPSYKYLNQVWERFRSLSPEISTMAQTPGMNEIDREAFLAAFHGEHGRTLVGFAVMGGIFGEGIDLVGDRLVGAVIVGVGLPQICLERDLIRNYFEERKGSGFEYAYVNPGLNRVLQAAGRVIRSETDRGIVLLIDSRFGQARYMELFPRWWNPIVTRSEEVISEEVTKFWTGCG
jgi:DNA excision repair protein ERCC-2